MPTGILEERELNTQGETPMTKRTKLRWLKWLMWAGFLSFGGTALPLVAQVVTQSEVNRQRIEQTDKAVAELQSQVRSLENASSQILVLTERLGGVIRVQEALTNQVKDVAEQNARILWGIVAVLGGLVANVAKDYIGKRKDPE